MRAAPSALGPAYCAGLDWGGNGGSGDAYLEVVVVVEELGFGVDFAGDLEGDGDVGFADGVVEDGFTVGAVFVEG